VSDVRAERDGPVVTLTLDRPDRRNAFDPNLLASLAEAFGDLSSDDSVRVVVLTGAGSAFSAGADLDWMRASRTLSRADNRAEAAAMADAFGAVDRCPKALVACADVAVAVEGTRFAFAEVRLGLLPATIAPYVVRAIGPGHARELFTSGRPFEAEEARTMGLVHRVVGADALDAGVAIAVSNFLACAPGAVEANKRLVRDLTASISLPDLPERIAEARAGPEGQEGLAAFVEKREPTWLRSPDS
jgi:methylglutaconyl-CoA hydratase